MPPPTIIPGPKTPEQDPAADQVGSEQPAAVLQRPLLRLVDVILERVVPRAVPTAWDQPSHVGQQEGDCPEAPFGKDQGLEEGGLMLAEVGG